MTISVKDMSEAQLVSEIKRLKKNRKSTKLYADELQRRRGAPKLKKAAPKTSQIIDLSKAEDLSNAPIRILISIRNNIDELIHAKLFSVANDILDDIFKGAKNGTSSEKGKKSRTKPSIRSNSSGDKRSEKIQKTKPK